MSERFKGLTCECGSTQFIWKTRHGKPTRFLTILGWVTIGQMQIQCQACGRKQFIARKLLGLQPRSRIPADVRRKLGLIGSLTTFRVSEKIVSLLGLKLDKMTIWRCVQKTAREMIFNLDPNELPHAEADGTGVPIRGIKKRGLELKVVVQHARDGGVRIAALGIDAYDRGWDKLFKPLLKTIKSFPQFLLVTDGDASILKGLGKRVKVLVQRCLWHIPHQLKYVLWQDKVERKSEIWRKILAEILDICAAPKLVEEELIAKLVSEKERRLDELIAFCRENGFGKSAVYLENARPHLFTALNNRLQGKTTSRVERVMRTVNQRINVGKWSASGALNVNKIRLAYYYNDFDVE